MGEFAAPATAGQIQRAQSQAPSMNPFLAALFNAYSAAAPQYAQQSAVQQQPQYDAENPAPAWSRAYNRPTIGYAGYQPTLPEAQALHQYNTAAPGSPEWYRAAQDLRGFGPGYGPLIDIAMRNQVPPSPPPSPMPRIPPIGGELPTPPPYPVPSIPPITGGLQTLPWNPANNGIMQRQPMAVYQNMPQPQDRVLMGSAGINPYAPKKNIYQGLL